jgi:hypothetical protein
LTRMTQKPLIGHDSTRATGDAGLPRPERSRGWAPARRAPSYGLPLARRLEALVEAEADSVAAVSAHSAISGCLASQSAHIRRTARSSRAQLQRSPWGPAAARVAASTVSTTSARIGKPASRDGADAAGLWSCLTWPLSPSDMLPRIERSNTNDSITVSEEKLHAYRDHDYACIIVARRAQAGTGVRAQSASSWQFCCCRPSGKALIFQFNTS